MARLLIIPVTAVLLFSACWGAKWAKAPGRIEDMDGRTAAMSAKLDSVMAVSLQNESLLRGVQAQTGMRSGEDAQTMIELVDRLERMLSSGAPRSSQDSEALRVTFEEAFRQYQQGGFSVAAQGFFEIAMGHPSSAHAPDALYYLALCHQSLGETHRAVEELVAVYFRYPTSERSPAALARAAAIYGAHAASGDMHRLETLVLESYPNSEEARLIRGRREGN
jgi:TolA-binding protein